MNATLSPPLVGATYHPAKPPRSIAVTIVIAHAAALALIAISKPVIERTRELSLLTVSIMESRSKREQPVVPPKPMPVVKASLAPVEVPPPTLPVIVEQAADITATPTKAVTAPLPPPPVRVAATGTITPPKFDADYLENPPPVYPRQSRRLNETGSVFLMVFVDAEGRPGQVDIQKSSQYERLDQAALEAVRHWRFVAARQGDKAVAAWVVVPIHFTLKS